MLFSVRILFFCIFFLCFFSHWYLMCICERTNKTRKANTFFVVHFFHLTESSSLNSLAHSHAHNVLSFFLLLLLLRSRFDWSSNFTSLSFFLSFPRSFNRPFLRLFFFFCFLSLTDNQNDESSVQVKRQTTTISMLFICLEKTHEVYFAGMCFCFVQYFKCILQKQFRLVFVCAHIQQTVDAWTYLYKYRNKQIQRKRKGRRRRDTQRKQCEFFLPDFVFQFDRIFEFYGNEKIRVRNRKWQRGESESELCLLRLLVVIIKSLRVQTAFCCSVFSCSSLSVSIDIFLFWWCFNQKMRQHKTGRIFRQSHSLRYFSLQFSKKVKRETNKSAFFSVKWMLNLMQRKYSLFQSEMANSKRMRKRKRGRVNGKDQLQFHFTTLKFISFFGVCSLLIFLERHNFNFSFVFRILLVEISQADLWFHLCPWSVWLNSVSFDAFRISKTKEFRPTFLSLIHLFNNNCRLCLLLLRCSHSVCFDCVWQTEHSSTVCSLSSPSFLSIISIRLIKFQWQKKNNISFVWFFFLSECASRTSEIRKRK